MMKTQSQKYARFVEWLWSKKDIEADFHIDVLTGSNAKADTSLPLPPLTKLESQRLFRYLERIDLAIHKKIDGYYASDVYSLNTVLDYKWEETINELKKPKWQRSWWFLSFKKGIIYIVSISLAALLGAYAGFLADRLVKLTTKSQAPSMDSNSNSEEKTNNR